MASSSSAAASKDWNAEWIAYEKCRHVSKSTFRPDVKDPFTIPEDERDTTCVVGSSFLAASGEGKTKKDAKTFFFVCTATAACEAEEMRRRGVAKDKVFTKRAEFHSCFGQVGDFPEFSPTGNYRWAKPTDRRSEYDKDTLKAARRSVKLSIDGSGHGTSDMLATETLVVDGVDCGPVISQMIIDGAILQGWQDALVKSVFHHKDLRAGISTKVMLEAKKQAKRKYNELKSRKDKTDEDKERMKALKAPRPPHDLLVEAVGDLALPMLRPLLEKRERVRDYSPYAITLNGEGDDAEKIEVAAKAFMAFKNKVLAYDKRTSSGIARMEAATFVDPVHAKEIPTGQKFNMVPTFEFMPDENDIRAWRPVPDTEKALNRTDLVAFMFTYNIYATAVSFGLFPEVKAVLVLKRASGGQAVDPNAVADSMGFLPYTAPVTAALSGEEAQEFGAAGFGGGGEWVEVGGDTSTKRKNESGDDGASPKKHRPDSRDETMQDA